MSQNSWENCRRNMERDVRGCRGGFSEEREDRRHLDHSCGVGRDQDEMRDMRYLRDNRRQIYQKSRSGSQGHEIWKEEMTERLQRIKREAETGRYRSDVGMEQDERGLYLKEDTERQKSQVDGACGFSGESSQEAENFLKKLSSE